MHLLQILVTFVLNLSDADDSQLQPRVVHLEKVICSSLVVRLIRAPLTSYYLITAINECPLVSGVQTLYNRLFQVKAGTHHQTP